MRELTFLAVLALLMASCHDETPDIHEDPASNLISPALYMDVSTREGNKPFTGVLSIAPCTEGTSIFYGNYVSRKLTPFYGYYFIKDGNVYPNENNRELNLPAGTYEMVYWGTPQYTEPIYAYPNVREPNYSIGGDFAAQDFTLLKNPNDTTYYPTFDLVYARHPVNVGTEDLDAALHRVVTGLKISVKGKDNAVLSTNIANKLADCVFTDKPSCVTTAGSSLMTCCSRFSTLTCAISGSVPMLNVIVNVYSPSSVEVDSI